MKLYDNYDGYDRFVKLTSQNANFYYFVNRNIVLSFNIVMNNIYLRYIYSYTFVCNVFI